MLAPPPRRGERFDHLVLVLRWATVAAGIALATPDLGSDPGVAAAITALLAWSAFRTFWLVPGAFAGTWAHPQRTVGDTPVEVVVAEVSVGLGVVALSGGWGSPFLLILVVGVLLAGLSRGYVGGFAAAGGIAVALGVVSGLFDSARADPATTAQAVLIYACTAAVAGFARRLFLEAAAGEEAAARRVAQLTEVNTLLSELARVAPGLPSSLDLAEALVAGIGHLDDLFDFTGAAVLLPDPATGHWRAEAARGLPTPPEMLAAALPAPLSAAIAGSGIELLGEPGGGLWPATRSGLYAPLVARDRLVAVIVLEHAEPGRYAQREAELLAGLAPPLALAVDNAIWFERLRRLGADAERERLARSLHDRVGAGLAYVGIELDRLGRLSEPGPDLARLRKEVGHLLAEVRETLGQLRTRVTEAQGLARLTGAHLGRFEARTGIQARLHHDPAAGRLPVFVEQELWRILQEALTNVERHSGAAAVDVRWSVDGTRACLEVADDGIGFEPSAAPSRPGSGLETIRERANAIGARLTVESAPSSGCRLALSVEQGPEAR